VANACPVRRTDGGQCNARPTASGYCFNHDPSLAERRRQARIAGGRGKSRVARGRKLLPQDLLLLDTLLDQAVEGVYQGSLAPSQGSAIAALVGAKVRLREVSLKIVEQSELAGRIDVLEERLHEIGLTSGKNGRVGYARRG
jgi:hypothetical protein